MKYKSINELDKFNLHDTELEKIKFDGKDMIWILKNANVTVKNSQNNNKNDMCVNMMKLTFKNIKIKNFVWLGSETRDEIGNLVEQTKCIEVKEQNSINELKKSLKRYCYIFGDKEIKNKEQYSYLFTMNTEEGVFEFILLFKTAVAEWNEYSGKSWYEE